MAITWKVPHEILGIEEHATAEEARATYLRLIRLHPPDRSPERFREIQHAYEEFVDQEGRIARLVEEARLHRLTPALIEQVGSRRRPTGPIPWIEALK